MTDAPFYDERYRESAVLGDGSRVFLRTVRPEDKALLVRGFERLSPASRYRRFLSPKSRLTEAELAYFTELDLRDHFALGAVADGGEGVGIARFIRAEDDPAAAEAAIAVVDDWQRRGLGRLLLERLAAAARERGIERLTARVLASNTDLREILTRVGAAVRSDPDHDVLHVEVNVTGAAASPAAAAPA